MNEYMSSILLQLQVSRRPVLHNPWILLMPVISFLFSTLIGQPGNLPHFTFIPSLLEHRPSSTYVVRRLVEKVYIRSVIRIEFRI
jgi:hypothetical protein